ncbi:MAG: HAMP domain-containing sensor histidine kinase [Euryarchaeota archaeon]|nr:HAMP domain-containing sensor histidine kinase [Euryarchaeota archaeon]
MKKEPFDLQKFLFGSINRKLTVLFFLVAVIAPTIGVSYFYSISLSMMAKDSEAFQQQGALLQTTAAFIIIVIAVDAGIVGFFISRSISKPLKKLHKATQEIEKGNFSVRTEIVTNDEIEQLGHAINKTAAALGRIDEERQQIDKAKSEFLSITSHELRTPLTPMKAQLQMLEQGFFGPLLDKQKESVTILMRNAERLDKIIEDFLEVSRIEAARLRFVFRKTDLKQTIKENIDFMTGFAKEKNITLVMNVDTLPIIDVDPDRISQVFRNLMHNAIKFSPENSTIKVEAIPQNDQLLFSIKDQGVGMTHEDQIRVFEPFYQIEDHLNRKHGGTGLGLTICRGIIEAQKGKIWVESILDKGSTFFFTVPLIPVKDIQPIKVLFSAKQDIDKKVKEKFTAVLGPMGLVEFNDLKNKHALGKEDLITYVKSLRELSILDTEQETEFLEGISGIFGAEKKR